MAAAADFCEELPNSLAAAAVFATKSPPLPEFKPEEDELFSERAVGAATTSKHMGRFFAG